MHHRRRGAITPPELTALADACTRIIESKPLPDVGMDDLLRNMGSEVRRLQHLGFTSDEIDLFATSACSSPSTWLRAHRAGVPYATLTKRKAS